MEFPNAVSLDRPLKIGMVCYPTFGGSGAVATELGRLLARRGHEVHFISYSRPFRLLEDYHENIFYHEIVAEQYPLFLGPLYTISAGVKIQETVMEAGLDLLHLHYALPHAISAMLAMRMLPPQRRIPVVTTLHGTDITLVGGKPSFHPAVKLGLEGSTALSCVSQWLKEATCREFSLCRDGRSVPEVIYNFIDTEIFKPGGGCGCKRARFAEPGEKILMHISNFRPVKRTGDVIEGFAKICGRIPSKLILLGDGPDFERAMMRARELGVADSIKALGKQAGVEHFLPLADCFLFPSESESFGLAALEAMACGVPVVGSRAGGLVEVVKDGESGFLLPAGDTDGMAEAAVRILDDGELARSMGAAARRRSVECFDASAIIPQYEALYERALATAGADPCSPSCEG